MARDPERRPFCSCRGLDMRTPGIGLWLRSDNDYASWWIPDYGGDCSEANSRNFRRWWLSVSSVILASFWYDATSESVLAGRSGDGSRQL
jgi:hypothetical protein